MLGKCTQYIQYIIRGGIDIRRRGLLKRLVMILGTALFISLAFFTLEAQENAAFEAAGLKDKVLASGNMGLNNKPSEGSHKSGGELFQLTVNPYVPDFILQGNYVVHGSSPDKRYTAYIYPDEWETIGDIYIKDNVEGNWVMLKLDQEQRVKLWDSFYPEGKYTPKKQILWLNNEEFVTIIGLAHGTVSKGGEPVKVNRQTGKGEILYPAFVKLNEEVVRVALDGEELVLEINVNDVHGVCLEKKEFRISLAHL